VGHLVRPETTLSHLLLLYQGCYSQESSSSSNPASKGKARLHACSQTLLASSLHEHSCSFWGSPGPTATLRKDPSPYLPALRCPADGLGVFPCPRYSAAASHLRFHVLQGFPWEGRGDFSAAGSLPAQSTEIWGAALGDVISTSLLSGSCNRYTHGSCSLHAYYFPVSPPSSLSQPRKACKRFSLVSGCIFYSYALVLSAGNY